nr:NAD-dependent epimerase/dehydratase family protein [uncultured Desulfuromonas sp.]
MIILVTGGGGFLGTAIVRKLCRQGHQVRSYSRRHYPHLDQLGVSQFNGDLTELNKLTDAVNDCDMVYHVAAKAGIWGDYAEYYQANVVGTENVIRACRNCGVSKLVYTSSPSVVFNGESMEGVDESQPYPDHYETAYPQTKALAEQRVIAANDDTLATVALRPHLIWGPGDNHLTPRIIEGGRQGKLRRIGKQDHRVDCIYVDNAADAHLLAGDRLAVGSQISGKCYFISQDDPRYLWDIVNAILATQNIPPVTKTVPRQLAYFLGGVCETLFRILPLKQEPPMTRFVAKELSTAHWFSMEAAKKDLNYQPKITIEKGLEQLKA